MNGMTGMILIHTHVMEVTGRHAGGVAGSVIVV
jgi:hypothetical protein